MTKRLEWIARHAADATWSAARAAEFARELGFAPEDAWAIAISTSELVTNAVRYAGWGRVILRPLHDPMVGLEVRVEDRGPGIADMEAVWVDGYSAGRFVREPQERTSLGTGLGAVRRLMDWAGMERREGGGLAVIARKWVGTVPSAARASKAR